MTGPAAGLPGYLDQVQERVDKYGWVVQGVLPVAGDTGFAWFYTVGLTGKPDARSGGPVDRLADPLELELMVVGLPVDLAIHLLNSVAAQALAGTVPTPGQPVAGLLAAGETLTPVAVDPALATDAGVIWPVATRFARERQGWPTDLGSVPMIWLAWRDESARWPWDEGYDLAHIQPLLGRPPSDPSVEKGQRP